MAKESRVKTMADLLRRGAALTERICPACSSPLFKLRSGNLWCAQCQKRVIVVEEGTQPMEATSPVLLGALELTLLTKIQEIDQKIKGETDPERLQRLNAVLSAMLENLQRVRRMKRK